MDAYNQNLSIFCSVCALDYVDLPGRRIVAVSHKLRPEILVGSLDRVTNGQFIFCLHYDFGYFVFVSLIARLFDRMDAVVDRPA